MPQNVRTLQLRSNLQLEPTADGSLALTGLPTAEAGDWPADALAVMSLCDGQRSPNEVVDAAATVAGIPPAVARTWIERALDSGLLQDTHRPRQTRVRRVPRHVCVGCGASCSGQLVGPLDDDVVDRIRDIHRALAQDYPRIQAHQPFVKGRTPSGEEHFFLNFPGKRCVFQADDMGCTIHRHYGAEAKPGACRRFPAMAIDDGDDIRVGVRPLCYHFHDALIDAAASHHPPTDAHLVDVGLVSVVVPKRLPVRAGAGAPPEMLDEARFQESQILAWCDEADMTLPELTARLGGHTHRHPPRERLSPLAAAAISTLTARLPGPVGPWLEQLEATPHGQRISALMTGIETLTEDALQEPIPHAWTSVALHGLAEMVYLRETSRFPTVALGALTVGLGALLAGALVGEGHDHEDEERARFVQHFVAWNRTLIQSPLFLALFPTPDAVAELVGALE